MSLRDYWLKKRFKKKKQIEANTEEIKNYPLDKIPLQIIDGDETKEADEGPIEINFKDVNCRSDVMLDIQKAYKEYVAEDAAYYEVPKNQLEEEEESFYVCYGCKYRFARLFDRFFHRKHETTESFVGAIHPTD